MNYYSRVKYSEDGKALVKCPNDWEGEFVVPKGVESIGESAFKGCVSLKKIAMPDSVTSIGEWAFEDCDNLQYNEYDNAYYLGNAENLYLCLIKSKSEEITSCSIHDQTKVIAISAFEDCSGLKRIEIPNGVTCIGIDAFYGCEGLESIVFPNSLASIGEGAFTGCENLKSIVIPNSVVSIGDGAFWECIGLTSIEIPNSVTGIAYCTFHGCESLKNIVIPSNVTHIEKYAFMDCKNLTEVHIGVEHLENLEVNECAFVGSPVKNCTLYVPTGTKKAYRMHKVFGEFGKIVEESRGNVDDNCEFPTKDDIFDLDSIPMDILDKGFQKYHSCTLNINRKNGINEKNQ